MPKIDISIRDLKKLIGREFTMKELDELLLFAKGELEEVGGDNIKVDIKDTNRPDLWSVEGIAREIRLHLNLKKNIKFSNSKVVVNVDKKTAKVRPYINCCIVKNLKFTDELIKELMDQQERLHNLLGRNREKIAIGISNFDLIKPDICYTIATEENKFPPLGYDEIMSPKEILEKHEKGIKYKHLVKEIPILFDSNKEVISMPPIINSNKIGKITPNTKNIFIDVTGTDEKLVGLTLLIIAMNFGERGGKIERVTIKYPDREVLSPKTKNKKAELNTENCRKISGLDLKDEQIKELLEKSGYICFLENGKIKLSYPSYRCDIFDERDIIEDVLISYNYNQIPSADLDLFTVGGESKKEKLYGDVEEIMTGFGFQQVLLFILSNEENENIKMNIQSKMCKIINPCSQNYTLVRSSILPSLLDFLRKNQHNEFPQKVFEVGRIFKGEEKTKLGALISNSRVNYEEISSVLDSLLLNLNIKYKLKESDDKRFIKGRSAKILINNKEVGILGEFYPKVLENFKLENPVTGFELDLEFLLE